MASDPLPDATTRHVLITGGGTGIGAAIARVFAEEGARVTLVGRRRSILDEQADTLRQSGAPISVIAFDVTDDGAVRKGFAQAAAQLGRIDVLVNNAGRAESAPFLRTSLASVRQMLDVNLVQLFACTQQVLPAMIGAGFGRVINIASTAALAGYPYVSGYCASKHAVLGFTRSLALETIGTGVTINAVCPGYTETPLLQGAVDKMVRLTGRSEADIRDDLAKGNPAGKLIKPAEVAAAVAWLASQGAEAITGQAIPVANGEIFSR
jgi:NAD(P)-dependent dehydrogenase (short-subunit alcohol dehydrogenase family)